MEFSEIILALVSIIVLIMGGIMKSIVTDIRKLNDKISSCQENLPVKYVLKDDYKDDIAEIKAMLSDMYGIIRKNGSK